MSDNQQFCLRWNNHQSTLVQVIDSLLSSGLLVDCTLAAEGQYLHAHKVILCACSPYLETLLSQHYEKHPIVILKDVKFQELKSMMDYMYKGEVNISQDQLGQFLKAAESLQIKGLTDGGGGENDSKDVGSTSHKRHDPPPIRKSVPPNQSRSSVVLPSHASGLTIEPSKRSLPSHLSESQPDSPIRSREGSSSPTPRKRRRPRRPSQGDDDGHQDNCDLPMQQQSILNTVPIIPQLPAGSSSTITKAPPPDEETDQPAESDVRLAESGLLKEKIEPQSELLIEPKTEYMEETNNDDSVEDLTLDDDDDYDNMDAAGPSHGGDNSNQSYGQWQMGERTHDEVFMAAQEAVGGGPRDSQGRAAVDIKSDEIEESASEAVSQLDDSDEDIYCCFVGNKATAARELDAATEDASISVAAKRSPTAEPNRSAEGTSASPERIQETPSYVTEFRLRVAEICANLKVPKACAMKQNVNVAAIPVPNEDTSTSTNTSPVIAGKRPLEIDYSAEVPKTKEVALISEDLTVDDDDCVIVDEDDTSLKRSSGVIVDKDDTSLKRSSAVIDRINSVIIRRAKLTKGRDVEAINVPATPEVDRVTGSVRAIGFGNKALNDAVESSLSKGIESQKQPFASPTTSRNWKRVTNEIAARSDTTNGPAIENDLELDCGVQPLPELAAELNPVPEPASVGGPPKRISSVEKISGVDSTVHRTDEFASLTGRKSVEVAKRRDNVYVPLHKTKIRKSARKKKSPPVDEFQEYIRREFHVTPFTIRLDRYRSEAEKEESKKLNFLSNFNLKKIGSSPIRREHSYFRPPFKIPKRIPSAGCRKSTQNRALLQKKKRKADSFVTVEIVKLDENSYDNDIHEEHSYNYRAHERKLSSDFTLKV